MAAVMVWSHSFIVRASIDDIYLYGFAPNHWFSFYPSYAGLDGVEGAWPDDVGSAIRVRYKLAAGRTMTLRQEVVAHERGSFIELDERSLKDLWIDSPRFDFSAQEDGSTKVTLTVSPDTAYTLARPLIWLVSQPFKYITPRAMKSFASAIEQAIREGGGQNNA